jgi:hypothetical protein
MSTKELRVVLVIVTVAVLVVGGYLVGHRHHHTTCTTEVSVPANYHGLIPAFAPRITVCN